MKIVINPQYAYLSSFIEKLPTDFDRDEYGICIYNGRNKIKQIQVDGLLLAVKSYKIPLIINRIAYKFFRKGKAQRSFEYAQFLLKNDINTPEPIGYIETRKNGLFHRSYYICLYESYPRIMREFVNRNIDNREDILSAFAAYTASIHTKGILHLDYSPGNILFDKTNDGEFKFSLLDLNRMRFGDISKNECLNNLNRLTPNTQVMTFVASEYARIRGWEKQECIDKVLDATSLFFKKNDLKNKRKEYIRSKYKKTRDGRRV